MPVSFCCYCCKKQDINRIPCVFLLNDLDMFKIVIKIVCIWWKMKEYVKKVQLKKTYQSATIVVFASLQSKQFAMSTIHQHSNPKYFDKILLYLSRKWILKLSRLHENQTSGLSHQYIDIILLSRKMTSIMHILNIKYTNAATVG